MDAGRSMRAVKNNLPTPSGEIEESEGPRWTCAVQGNLITRLGEDKGNNRRSNDQSMHSRNSLGIL